MIIKGKEIKSEEQKKYKYWYMYNTIGRNGYADNSDLFTFYYLPVAFYLGFFVGLIIFRVSMQWCFFNFNFQYHKTFVFRNKVIALFY